MRLEEIGFYTLSDERVSAASATSPLSRCELILTGRYNFRCPYCRHVGGTDIPYADAERTVRLWAADGLRALRFSGGEPTLYPRLCELVTLASSLGIERIAVSTNGSAPLSKYRCLLAAGVNDLSVSLDACCAADGDKMAGGVSGAWSAVVDNIRKLASGVYLTVGVVLTPFNGPDAERTIEFAASLGVSDIRVIPAAQCGQTLPRLNIPEGTLARFPILRYRVENLNRGRSVRGLGVTDSRRCKLVLDDMAVMGGMHYPCIIYMREGGAPIGKVSDDMRLDRLAWSLKHDILADPICAQNCLDVCVDYNNKATNHGS